MLSACATNPLQPDDPNRQSLSPDSKGKALFLLAMPRMPVPYIVKLEAVDESTGELQTGPVTGWARMQIYPERPYSSDRVTPGTYAFISVIQQGFWHACFQSKTLILDVKEGEVVFLGEIQTAETLTALQAQVEREGRGVSRHYEHLSFFDGIPPPSVLFPGGKEEALKAVQQYVRTHMPGVTAPVRLAEYRTGKFNPGTSLGEKVCSAY